MKKINNSIPILIIFSILFFVIYNYEIIQIFLFDIFNDLTEIRYQNFLLFFVLLFIFNFIFFLTPIPTFPLIVFNGFLLGNTGFFFTYILIIMCSLIIFKLSKKLTFYLEKIPFYKNFFIKLNNNKNNDFNFFAVASSRYIIPYFFHNIFFGSILKSTKIFLAAIVLAEIPIVYILNMFGKYLVNIQNIESFDIKSIFKFELIFSLIILFFLIFIVSKSAKYLKDKIS